MVRYNSTTFSGPAADSSGEATMQKWMCLGAIGIAGLALLLCALDLILGIPFGGGPYLLADIGGILTAGILMYLAFNAYQDVK
jgi:hypothetical protein